MKKSFFTLLKHAKTCEISGPDNEVNALEYDSRKVSAGAVFFALSGLHTDGEKYIASAVEKGAKAIVYESKLSHFEEGVSYARVKDARLAMSLIAAAFYDWPSKHLKVIGVTGTEGKSSTVSFIWQLLTLLGKKCGYFSTVSYAYGGFDTEKKNPEHQTTPESTTVQKHLCEMLQAGCEYAVVEASSHGLSERTARLSDVLFDVGLFMNVTEEHLEFHKTFENYRHDKANLFRKLDENDHVKDGIGGKPCPSFGTVNLDDPSAEYFARATQKPVYGYTTGDGTAGNFAENLAYVLKAFDIAETSSSLDFKIAERNGAADTKIYKASARLAGRFNVKNILASSIAVSKITGKPLSDVLAVVPELKPITGRMFYVDEGQNFRVLIDYAHTPSSFEMIMPALAKKAQNTGTKLIALFGSGGERDTAKRPEQGRVASKYCNIIILADEDPRGEGSMPIIDMIAKGTVGKEEGKTLFCIPDRKAAIRKAFSLCTAGDTVLLLGKGHENTIIYADHAIPYDEEAEARAALREMQK